MSEFELEVNSEDAEVGQICSMYWLTNEDGSFAYTVKAVGERFGMPASRVSKFVADSCVARSASRCCSECGQGFTYRSRAEWTSGVRFWSGRCGACVEREKRVQEEERERIDAVKRAAVNSKFAVEEDGLAPRVDSLDLPAAFALAALFEDAEEISAGISIPTVDRVDRLTPTPDYDFKLLELLVDQRLVQVHPCSPLDSFVWNKDGTLSDSYYPALASYYMSGSGSLGNRVKQYLANLSPLLSRESWPDHWVEQFSSFWFDLAVSECKAYLVYMLQRHGLNFTPGRKTDDVLRHALRWYSIGQVYYFIWRAARDSAAYKMRDGVPAKQAANSAITRISADVERAYAQGWDVSVYRRDSRLPLSTLSHILFSRALKLEDPMAYSPIDLPMRRVGLELAWKKINADTFERLIFQLLTEAEGYENVDWLMHTNAPDHGRDVSAIRLRRDPLSGHTAQRVAIQCKHWLGRPVRAVDVNQSIVSLSHWQNPPFDVLVIATSGRFTSDAVAWVERHNSSGMRPIIEIWNDARLEVLLNERPHLIAGYELR